MRIESKLCHTSENKVIIQVNGWLDGKKVGSAHAEGTTVEIAEDKAISRLNKRLITINNPKNDSEKIKDSSIKNETKIDLPKTEAIKTINELEEPNDWSNELAAIDFEIRRLNWSREDEIVFLEKKLGYKNRNKITKYLELIKYLDMLKQIDNSNSNKLSCLIDESEIILKELSWDYKRGSEYLQKEFNVSTRKELDENQLISFVAKLKAIRDQI